MDAAVVAGFWDSGVCGSIMWGVLPRGGKAWVVESWLLVRLWWWGWEREERDVEGGEEWIGGGGAIVAVGLRLLLNVLVCACGVSGCWPGGTGGIF